MTPVRHLLLLALLTALSLALFLFEGMLPLPLPVPGAKLGLANVITVIALYLLPRRRDAFLILLLRTGLGSLFGGGPSVFLYSIAGGLLSLAAMCRLRSARRFSLPAVSAAGGFFHNVGQLACAALVMESAALWGYLAVLGPLGLLTGLLVGTAAQGALRRLAPLTRSAGFSPSPRP